MSNSATGQVVTVKWFAGWDKVEIDPNNVRDLTHDEARYHANRDPEGPWVGGSATWLRCRSLPHGVGLSSNPDNQAVRVLRHLASGD